MLTDLNKGPVLTEAAGSGGAWHQAPSVLSYPALRATPELLFLSSFYRRGGDC